MRRRALLVCVALALASAGCGRARPPGVLAAEEPAQELLPLPASSISYHEYEIAPLASFHLTARVLGAKRYRLGREAGIAPVDLALGWGPMSDSAILRDISITQLGRYYMWSSHDLPIERDEIVSHSANMHVIPATLEVLDALLRVRSGDIVTITGELVQVRAPDGWLWTSSLSRTDSGDGACELVWARELGTR